MSWFSDLGKKISREAAQINTNIVNQFELARTGQTPETRVEWRKERALAIERVRDAMLISGYSKAEIESVERAIFDKWNSTQGPGWQKALEQNVREYGKEAGALLIAAGSALQALPGIGTVIGVAVGGAGIGLVMAGNKQAVDYAKKQEIFAGLEKFKTELSARLGENPEKLTVELEIDAEKVFGHLGSNKTLIQTLENYRDKIRKYNEKLCELNNPKISTSDQIEKEKNRCFTELQGFISEYRKTLQILNNSIMPVKDDRNTNSDKEIKDNNEFLDNANSGEKDKNQNTEIKQGYISRFFTFIKLKFFTNKGV